MKLTTEPKELQQAITDFAPIAAKPFEKTIASAPAAEKRDLDKKMNEAFASFILNLGLIELKRIDITA